MEISMWGVGIEAERSAAGRYWGVIGIGMAFKVKSLDEIREGEGGQHRGPSSELRALRGVEV